LIATHRILENRLQHRICTRSLQPVVKRNRLEKTEQGAFFDDPGQVEGREKGREGLLNALDAELKRDRAAA
jgi:hypothetical protein